MLRAYRRRNECYQCCLLLATSSSAEEQRRTIATLKTRTMELFECPIEFRMGERYTNNPGKLSGVQFLTHFSHYQRKYDKDAVIDYLHWGKTVGQAHMPHRHQRVAFDFNDSLHPTALPKGYVRSWTEGQDPSVSETVNVDKDFNPNAKPWNSPVNFNTYHSQFRMALDGQVRLPRDFNFHSMQPRYLAASDTVDQVAFGNGDINEDGLSQYTDGITEKATMNYPTNIPGIHRPFLGEKDSKMMQAMARSLPLTHGGLCSNSGRYSRTIYINQPKVNNALSGKLCSSLSHYVDKFAHGFRTKMLVVTAAQSGLTDFFSAGLDLESLARHAAASDFHRNRAAALRQQSTQPQNSKKKYSAVQREQDIVHHAEKADYHAQKVDMALRNGHAVLWRMFTATKPVLTLINGKCRNIGNGLALLTKYPGLRDSSEFAHEGPQFGITPFGGMTHLLARPETTLKYPGLAEFVMLTGFPLYAGDALRLGWSDLFSTLPDLDYHIREWFNDSEHLHADAVAWQIGQLLETCFKADGGKLPSPSNTSQHAHSMERSAVTPARARWIEDVFADQPSVAAIVSTLEAVEKLPFSDPNNTRDTNLSARATLPDVATGLHKLYQTKMHFALTPWDVTQAPETLEVRQVSEIFQDYFFEKKHNTASIGSHQLAASTAAVSHSATRAKQWKAFREKEYKAYQRQKLTAHPRHVFIRLEGCENTLVDFEFDFNKSALWEAAAKSGRAITDDERQVLLLHELKSRALVAMGFPADRLAHLLWCLPNFDTATVRTDSELLEALHADPGVEDPARPTKFPPIYFCLSRDELYFSEWAFSVRHHLLLMCPFALKASLQLLRDVRGDNSATKDAVSMKEALALEFRYAVKLASRRDFHTVGICSNRSADEWERLKNKSETVVPTSEDDRQLVAQVDFEDVFERDAVVNGHKFVLRPRWSPRTLEEVADADIAALTTPLQFNEAAGMVSTELDPHVAANSADHVFDTAKNIVGFEVVPRLGEKDEKGSPVVAPLVADARVPRNVNFYEMARHPWADTPHSWRYNGFTDASQQHFRRKYDESVGKVYDPDGQQRHSYWPKPQSQQQAASGPADAAPSTDETDQQLLNDRFWSAIRKAESATVEPWAQAARESAKNQKFDYLLDVASSEEKVYDDHYYRWFIRPGEHPNPSGVLRSGGSAKPSS